MACRMLSARCINLRSSSFRLFNISHNDFDQKRQNALLFAHQVSKCRVQSREGCMALSHNPHFLRTPSHQLQQVTTLALLPSHFHFCQNAQNSNKGKEGQKYDPEYQVAVAEAVRTLLDELPNVFQCKLSYHIYTPDMELKIAGHSIKNLGSYRASINLSRCAVKLFCKYAFVDVWRIRHDEEGRIFIRWRLHFLGRIGGELDFEGMSEYCLDRKGKIYCHIVDPLIRNKKGKKSPAATLLEQLWPRPSLQPG